jgi:ribosomal protein S27E
MSTMIYWEAHSNEMKVACSACGSLDTQVSFEFLRYTRHTCRACSTTFTHSGGRVQRRDHDDDARADDVGTCTNALSSALMSPVLAVGAL